MIRLEDYMDIVGDEIISEIYRKATPLNETRMVHINSTYYGGGVAEMLKTLVPLLNDVGIGVGWRVIHGSPDFFTITKDFHNGMQGDQNIDLSEERRSLYEDTNREFSIYTHLDHDLVVVHDPQPLPLVKYYKKKQPWVWRCHIDISGPNPALWDFLKKYILRYERVIISNDRYRNTNLPVDQSLIYPAIDPLSPKNMELSTSDMDRYMIEMGIPMDKPIITQVSRFDKWKDPIGVVDTFKKVKERVDSRLVLCGSMASDDPEGYKLYDEVKQYASEMIANGDIFLIANVRDTYVNALQRASTVIVQKSIKEGFGLTLTEALWKGKAVVSSNVGGLGIQVEDGKNGFVHDPYDNEGFANSILKLIRDEELRQVMGMEAKRTVREKFLITRLMIDYINLLLENAKRPGRTRTLQ